MAHGMKKWRGLGLKEKTRPKAGRGGMPGEGASFQGLRRGEFLLVGAREALGFFTEAVEVGGE